eukprot:scaffold870_cov393-Prasinococcus_capsulatus_cf.AAC.38
MDRCEKAWASFEEWAARHPKRWVEFKHRLQTFGKHVSCCEATKYSDSREAPGAMDEISNRPTPPSSLTASLDGVPGAEQPASEGGSSSRHLRSLLSSAGRARRNKGRAARPSRDGNAFAEAGTVDGSKTAAPIAAECHPSFLEGTRRLVAKNLLQGAPAANNLFVFGVVDRSQEALQRWSVPASISVPAAKASSSAIDFTGDSLGDEPLDNDDEEESTDLLSSRDGPWRTFCYTSVLNDEVTPSLSEVRNSQNKGTSTVKRKTRYGTVKEPGGTTRSKLEATLAARNHSCMIGTVPF